MPDLWTTLSAPFVQLLGWVLLHFVWQGALLAAGLGGVLYLLRDRAPTLRYATSCVALIGLLVLPIGTGVFLADSVLGPDRSGSASVAVMAEGTVPVPAPEASTAGTSESSVATLEARAADWVQPVLPWVVLGWVVGVLLFSVRLAGGAWQVRRLRRTSRPVSERWRDRLSSLAEQMGVGRDVSLHASRHVDSPMVAGWWRPVILMPAGLLSGMPPAQVEALLMHELAHVRRHDVLVGRIQAVVETLLFFHPATWWISRRVREAREACCDDRTVEAGTDRTVYARALAALAERAVSAGQPAGVLAAADGSLLARIRRLLDPSAPPSGNARRLSMAVALLLLVALPLGVAACASQQSTMPADAPEAPESERADSPPAAPHAPEPNGPTVVTVRDDSSRRVITVRGDSTVVIDRLDDGGYVLRYRGERADTLHGPDPGIFEEEERAVFDSTHMTRRLRGLHFRSDSLRRVILGDVNPDSLERLIQTRFRADSLKRVLRTEFDLDSLEHRALKVRWHSDSLERAFSPDSLRRWHRQHGDTLRTHMLRLRRKIEPVLDSLHHRIHPALDSLRNRMHPALDSLRRELRPGLDSLRQLQQHRADTLRRHFEHLRERMEREVPERLREEARALRERAERLEKRAEAMEDAPPEPPADSTEGGGR